MSTLLAFQLRRVGRNRQFLFFTVLLPALFTVFFTKVFGAQAGTGSAYQEYATGSMVAMMAYGGMGAALGATIRISFDRASGWLRQLRVTPVPASSVVAVDVLVGVLLALPSLVVVALVGRFVNGVQLALPTWLALVAVLWLGAGAFVDGSAAPTAQSVIHSGSGGRSSGRPRASKSSSVLTTPPVLRRNRARTIISAYTSPFTTARWIW